MLLYEIHHCKKFGAYKLKNKQTKNNRTNWLSIFCMNTTHVIEHLKKLKVIFIDNPLPP